MTESSPGSGESGSSEADLDGGAPRKPRLLIVITLAETGGAQTYVRNLLPAVVGRYDVTVAAHGGGPLIASSEHVGARFVPLRWVRRGIHPVRDLAALVELWRLCRQVRPDIVHLNSSKVGILGALASALAGVPVRIFTAHGWAFSAAEGTMAGRTYRLLHRLVRPLLTWVVCVSESERSAGLAAGACDEARSQVIVNGVAARSVVAGPRRGIVSVTRLRVPKDILTLVRAVALQPDLPRVTVLGDGPDRGVAEAELEERGIADRVELVGDVEDPMPFLDRAQVFVLSTLSEGLPMAVLEAMSAGLPVVASAVGGIPEIVADGETGFLVPPADPQRLGEALLDLIRDAGRAARLGDAGRAAVSARFDVERSTAAHVALYDRLAAHTTA